MNLNLNLRSLSISELLNQTAQSALTEQAATLALLEHLAEVERRKAYAGRSAPTLYTSLFDYLRRGLHYSDSQAAERVAATKLLLQSPTVKPAFESGKLSLTSAAQVQRFVERERRLAGINHSADALTQAIAGKSKREVDQELFNRASPKTQAAMNERIKPVLRTAPTHPESTTAVSLRQVQVTATVDETLIQQARSLVYTESVSELIERALKLYVQHHAKRRGKAQVSELTSESRTNERSTEAPNAPSPCRQSSKTQPPRRPHISIHIRRLVWTRAQNRCEFKNKTHQRCSATHALEMDHILPISLGGDSDIQNLQLLCRVHNQLKGSRLNNSSS